MVDPVIRNAPEGFRPVQTVEPPEGFQAVQPVQQQSGGSLEQEESRSVWNAAFNRAWQRLRGTDIDDPLSVRRQTAIAAGATAGGMIGARFPVAPGVAGAIINPVVGATVLGGVGAVAGAIAPEMTLELMETLGFRPEGYREQVGLSNDDLKALAESEALLDVFFGTGFQAAAMAARPVSRFMAGVGRQGAELGRQASEQGLAIPAVMAGTGRFGRFFTSVFGRFPLIGGPLVREGRQIEAEVERITNLLPGRIAPVIAHSDVGREIYKDATELVTRVGQHFDESYEMVYKAADQSDGFVTPIATVEKGQEIIRGIQERTPEMVGGGPAGAGAALDSLRQFIETEILPLGGQQSLRQMDGLLAKIDQQFATFEPEVRRHVTALVSQLRTAAQRDVVQNWSGPPEIARALRAVDAEFSDTMSFLFETSTAKRFGSVRRQGLRGINMDTATRTPVDQIARLVVNLESPQAIEELSRLVTPETMQSIASRAVEDALAAGMREVNGNRVFNPEIVRKNLGLDREASGRALAIGTLLEKTSGLTLAELNTFLDVASAIRNTEIPNMSAFIARRGMIGGLTGIWRGLLPGITATTGAGLAGTAVGGPFMGALSMLMVVGGGRTIASLLANPRAVAPLRTILSETAKVSAKRKAILQFFRLGMSGAGEVLGSPAEVRTAVAQGLRMLVGTMVDAQRRLEEQE